MDGNRQGVQSEAAAIGDDPTLSGSAVRRDFQLRGLGVDPPQQVETLSVARAAFVR